MQKRPTNFSFAALLLVLALALFGAGCASTERYPESGFIAPQADQQHEEEVEEAYDPFEDDPFDNDDPFEDDPFDQDDSYDSATGDSEKMASHRSSGDDDEVQDPLEPVNRAVFWVNDKLYTYALKPVARVYRYTVPEPARQGIGNFFSNLASPVRAINSFLQFKFNHAAEELSRFTINSTMGVLGFIDIAGQNGLHSRQEDMGQTFGHYGVGHGFYIVLPFFGPSSARDAVGKAGDFFADSYIWPFNLTLKTQVGLSATNTVNTISLDKDTYEAIIKQSIDPYATMRSGYLQMRKAKVEQ